MKKIHNISSLVALLAFSAINSQAQYVLGGFQGAGDPTDAGWYNLNTGNPITTDASYSFVAAGVPGDPLSLQGAGTGFGGVQLQLQFSPAEVAAFNANTLLSFTFSAPSGAATSGYNQIYNLVLNAPGYGYHNVGDGGNAAATWGTYSTSTGFNGNNQNGEPNFYFYSGAPALQSQTVTFNYSSFLPAIIAGGEGYLQLDFTFNSGGGAPAFDDMNNVVLSNAVPEPGTIALGVIGASSFLLRRRGK